MKTVILKNVWLTTFLGIILFIIFVSLFLVKIYEFKSHAEIFSLAVTIDITLGIPILYYSIISRKLKIHPITIVVVFLICLGIANYILPKENHNYLDLIKKGTALIELTVITYGFIKIRKIIKSYNQLSVQRIDFVRNLYSAIESVFGKSKALYIAASEVFTFRYGLFFWKVKKEIFNGQKYFTTYKKTGVIGFTGVLTFIMLFETIVVHFFLWHWNKNVALVVTILTIYGIVFIIADIAAIIKRPIVFYQNKLYLRIGIRASAIIDPEKIEKVEIIKRFNKSKEKIDCSLLRSPNILITLNEPVTVIGYYGYKRTADQIAFNIDNTTEFINELRQYKEHLMIQ
ncbi:MAG: hypothetical protein JXR46_14700 [Calditrichaceae bacterium]|nr:hypothetical protein [Calditrichaceae bacterium]MBN2710289.1 hypothetical protein [Calditrichaceae bacterium]RQV93908.1 MAG: hypothetical protein EH224_11835 [Calditrichota bacterium]